jgi:molecular chaperone GrpE (heat shock protein)
MPDDQTEIGDLDFAGEMQHLAYEAQSKSSPPGPRLDRKELMLALGQMVRPLALELENIKRSNAENSVLLTVLAKAQKAPQPPSEPEGIDRIYQQLQRLGVVETANQKLFDALHTELKGYKDNFLFDALQRPFIRDLVSIFDDFSAVRAQISKRLALSENAPGDSAAHAKDAPAPVSPRPADPAQQTETEFLRTLAGNVSNQVHHLLEIFLRMEVVLSESLPGTPVDKKVHRTMGYESATRPEQDWQVVQSLKPGFTWRQRMIRPEEVVVYRWTPDPAPESDPPEDNGAEDKDAEAPAHRRSVPDAKMSKAK